MNKLVGRNHAVIIVRGVIFLIVSVLLLVPMASELRAQGSTDGTTPLGLAPGSPSGSYPLSDFDIVNLYNGGLNLRLPLYQITGRGGAGYPITLHDQKKWTVYKQIEPGVGAFYYADAGWWSDEATLKILEAGKVDIRSGFREQPTGFPVEGLTRVTFTAPDGTEYELRDQLTNGQPKSPVSGGFNRGTVFAASDGTTATFVCDWDIRDDPTFGQGFYDARPDGYLMLRDGTRFRVDDGKVSWMRDRNGNKVTFGYDFMRRVTSITDSLNRLVTISYATGTPGFTQITFNGFGAAARTVKIGQANLSSTLRSGYSMQTIGQLFPELHGGGPVDSIVINYIELPDGRTYQLRYNPYGELARVVLPTGASQTRHLRMTHGKTTIYSVRYLPDGKRLISASYDGSIVMWDTRSRKRLWYVDLDAASKSNNSRTISNIQDMDLSRDGSVIAISVHKGHVVGDTLTGEDGFYIALLDSRTGQVTRTMTGHSFLIGRLAFSPNGELLLSESGDRTARLWNVNTGQEVLQIKLKEKGARVAFSPDGKIIAIATQPVWGLPPQPDVGLFDAGTGQLLREFLGSKSVVAGLAFSPDGQTLAIAGGDSIGAQIDLWELKGQEPKITFPMPRHEINIVRFSPDGKLLAVCGYGKGKGFVEVRNISTAEAPRTFTLKEEVSALDFSPDGKQLVIANEKGQITLIRSSEVGHH